MVIRPGCRDLLWIATITIAVIAVVAVAVV
jgi:hypothetical protein